MTSNVLYSHAFFHSDENVCNLPFLTSAITETCLFHLRSCNPYTKGQHLVFIWRKEKKEERQEEKRLSINSKERLEFYINFISEEIEKLRRKN